MSTKIKGGSRGRDPSKSSERSTPVIKVTHEMKSQVTSSLSEAGEKGVGASGSHRCRHITMGPTEVLLELTGQTGSLLYMSPEVYNEEPYNEKADVFSFAMVLYELVHRRTLMNHIIEMNPRASSTDEDMGEAIAVYAQMVANGHRCERLNELMIDPLIFTGLSSCFRPPINAFVLPSLSNLMVKCWAHKASDRPSMAEVQLELEKIVKEEDLSCLNARPGGAGCSDFCSIQ